MADQQQEDRPQQTQTLSLRISEALRKRLEQIRELTSLRKGENVSTSEIAKQLLESAHGDRLEVVELLREPTETLLRIRNKCEAQHPLSRAEWTVLAYHVQQGQEAFSKNPISRESTLAILEAFQAVHKLRTKATSNRDEYYLGNLPNECRPAERKHPATAEMVRQTVTETLRYLSDPATKWRPGFVARNLYVFLDGEEVVGADALNQALRPYWQSLWRVAARGHYFLTGKPVREESKKLEHVYQPGIPTVSEAKYSLSFVHGERNDFDLLLTFPGPRGPMYPIGGYPKIVEFHAMLAALNPKARSWNGECFRGYVTHRDEENEFWFRAHQNGITFGFSEEEWGAVRKLFRRAWETPEVQAAWNALMAEYGEL